MKYIITVVLILTTIITGVIYLGGKSVIDNKAERQVASINAQIAQFEEKYNNNKVIGEEYQQDIIDACIYFKMNDNFKALYAPVTEDEHYAILDFVEAFESGETWDGYDSYCRKYADNKGLTLDTLWGSVNEFEALYSGLSGDEKAEVYEGLIYEENLSDFSYRSPVLKSVDFFGEVSSNRVFEVMQFDCADGFTKLVLEIVWEDGKIVYLNRGV